MYSEYKKTDFVPFFNHSPPHLIFLFRISTINTKTKIKSTDDSAMTNTVEYLKLTLVTPSCCSIEQFSPTVLLPKPLK